MDDLSFVDDIARKHAFETFVNRLTVDDDGKKDERSDDDDDDAGDARGVLDDGHSSDDESARDVKFTASNVGEFFETSEREFAFAFGEVRASSAVMSAGFGDFARARVRVDDERACDDDLAPRTGECDAMPMWWESLARVGKTTFIAMDDDGGAHALIGTSDGAAYAHATMTEARVLSALRNVACACATFVSEGAGSLARARALVGANDGRVFDAKFAWDENARRFETSCDVAFEAPNGAALTSVRCARKVGKDGKERFAVMFTTKSKMYALLGEYSLESVLAKARARVKDVEALVEMPESGDVSALCVWAPPGRSSTPTRFAWLTAAAVYRGGLNFDADDASGILEQHGALPFPTVKGAAEGERPRSIAMTEFHIFLLYEKCLVAMNAISGDVEGTISMPIGGASTFAFTDPMTSTVYAANSGNLLRILIENEGANMWRVYCDQCDYAQSIAACRTDLQRQFVFTTQADRMLKSKRYDEAAKAFASAGAAHAMNVILKTFADLKAYDAMYSYVEGRLDGLPVTDKSRRLNLAMWLLCEHVKVATASPNDATKGARLCEFLRKNFHDLDESETLRILGHANRLDDEILFAELCGDYDRVLDHFMYLGDGRKALQIAGSPNVPRVTLNRVLPKLIQTLPKESIDFMLTRPPTDDDVTIIEQLSADENLYSKTDANTTVFANLARYLETITAKPDGAARGNAKVHDALLNLYVRQLEMAPTVAATLTKFILDAVDDETQVPYYNVQYAIQMCEKYGAHRSAVYAYCVSANFDMAMHVALSTLQDLELAKVVTERAAKLHTGHPGDDDEQKKLWIEIAKWAIQKSGAWEERAEDLSKDDQRNVIRSALSFLNEANGVLRVEDVLPLLPDFTIVDDVKELVLQSLDEHRSEIEQLKKSIEELNLHTQDIQDHIDELEEKTVVISRDEKCAECNKPVVRLRLMASADDPELLAPFYVFPCEMAFHTECLIRRLLPLLLKDQRTRALALMRMLKVPLPRQLKLETKYWGPPPKSATGLSANEAVTELEDILCADCPFCGGLELRLLLSPEEVMSPEEIALDKEFGIPLGKEEGWDDVRIIKIHARDISSLEGQKFIKGKLPEDWPPHEFFFDDF